MKINTTCILLVLLFTYSSAFSQELSATEIKDTTLKVINRAYDTSWLHDTTVKYGLLSSLCLAQSLTGATEGYHFGGLNTMVNDNNYHAYETVKRFCWVTTGWFGYATYKQSNISGITKLRRGLGSALIARDCFEWSYKLQRYNNPFDYTPEHNRHAIVYVTFIGGHITDAYISTGNLTTPLADISFLLFGLLLFK
jgi:hypothetical protein